MLTVSSRRLSGALGLALTITVLAAGAGAGTSEPASAQVQQSASAAVREPGAAKRKKPRYRATIVRTKHGIPHITARNYGSLGFGSGYAAMETNGCTLADVLITARGTRSRYLGAEGTYRDGVSVSGTNLQMDALVTDLRNRKVVERLLADPVAGPGKETRAMVTGYVAGVNKYLRSIGGAKNYPDRACRGAAYLRPNATTLDVWYGIYLANILGSTGHFLQQIVGASPPTLTDPGLPDLGSFAPVPTEVPSAEDMQKALGKDPSTGFGSNATAIGRSASSTGRGMLLGNPHFPWTGRYRFSQQHLTIPGKYDVAGASLIGSPVINIGWNKNVAWSHTVSTGYRFTPYEYRTLVSPTTYLSGNGLIRQLERRIVTVTVKRPDGSLAKVTEDLYRTPQGYVIDDPSTLMGWTPLSFFAIRDANGEQLRTLDTFFDMGRAGSVRDLIARQDRGGGMPWVNTIAADRAGNVAYADHSVVPNVSNAMADRCMTPIGRLTQALAGLPGLDGTFADSSCAWGTDADAARPGVLGPKNMPVAYRTDWVMNANDSYWLPNPAQQLNGFARIIGCEKCERTMRTRMVSQYVLDRLKKGKVTPASLRGTQHQNRVRAGEVMRANGDLDKVCQAAGGGQACVALAKWDGHSNTTSRGYQVFQEFVTRIPDSLLSGSIWKVPFDAQDPLNTPRDLDETNGNVIGAMKSAIAHLEKRKIAPDAPWGSLQVAGDRGAPAIPLGGGNGDLAGNANALASVDPVTNAGYLSPITFGSSHIQAIAFGDRGRVNARTILTYGQSENPWSPWSSDQTRLFGRKQWVVFPWTDAQIRKQRISTVRVRGR
ncbi:penicillin acylase family protein [Nocardioides dubius]|uniref:Penicillin acylase family protein n=1 Tax=Nocardioides dubius TaxID=317019 RepID=A0ABN1TS35_9ACTN